MAAIRGRTLLGGTVLESWLHLCPSHPSSVAPSSSSWFISSLLGCRPSGVSVPGNFVSCLGYVLCVVVGVFVSVRSDVCDDVCFIIYKAGATLFW